MEFREVLKKLRSQRGLSQARLAEGLNLSKSIIGAYETGDKKPSFETLELIADYFNVDVDYLLGRESGSTYYLDPETARLADEMKNSPGRRVLMSAAEDLTPEETIEVIDFINNLKKGDPTP